MHAGKLLTTIREGLGLKSAQFADFVGASAGQMHDWESNRQPLTLEAAGKLERTLKERGVDPLDLIGAVVRQRTAA